MPWQVSKEHKDHFEITGNSGNFRIAKHKLSPATVEKYSAMCKGGKVPQKLAEGGEVGANSDEAQGPDYLAMADTTADKYGIPRPLLHGLVAAESNWDPEADAHKTHPESHAYGLTQLQPATAKAMGVTNIKDPAQQLEGGAKYLRSHFDKFGSWDKAVAAYHDGPGAVEQNGISEATRPYVDTVFRHAGAQSRDPFPQTSALESVAGKSGPSDDEAQGQALTAFLKDPRSVEQAPERGSALAAFHPTPDNTDDPTLAPAGQAAQSNADALANVAPPQAQPQATAAPDLGQQAPAQSPFPAMPQMPDWDKPQGMLDESLKRGMEGADVQAQAEKQKAQDVAAAYLQHNQKLAALEEQRLSETKAVQERIDKVTSDIEASKIDPNHFWNSKSDGQKMAAGIGMVLAGIGSGMTGQPNMAVQFIQRGIDRDIEAQKMNLDKKQNLLGYMYKKYGNIQEASIAAKSYLTANLAGQVGLAGARAGSAEAQANAQMIKSHLLSSALQPMVQMAQGKYANEMQKLQMEFTRNLYSIIGGQQGGQSGGYLPSQAPAPQGSDPSNPLKYAVESRKDAAERTLVGPGGKPFLAYDKETKAKVAPMLQAASNVEGALKEMEKLSQENSGIPGTDAADLYKKYRAGIVENWGRASGNAQPSEVISKNLESVMPTSYDAFVRGGNRFIPIKRMLVEHVNNLYRQAGLHPSALRPMPLSETTIKGVGGH